MQARSKIPNLEYFFLVVAAKGSPRKRVAAFYEEGPTTTASSTEPTKVAMTEDNKLSIQIDSLVKQSWKNSRDSFYRMRGFEVPPAEVEPESLEKETAKKAVHEDPISSVVQSGDKSDEMDEGDGEGIAIPVQLGERLEELLAARDDREELESDLKNELMRWFWMGYYQGRAN